MVTEDVEVATGAKSLGGSFRRRLVEVWTGLGLRVCFVMALEARRAEVRRGGVGGRVRARAGGGRTKDGGETVGRMGFGDSGEGRMARRLCAEQRPI